MNLDDPNVLSQDVAMSNWGQFVTLRPGLVLRISRSSKGMNFGWMMVLEVWGLNLSGAAYHDEFL